jgi:hypothetical protein
MQARPASALAVAPQASARASRQRIAAAAVLISLVSTGITSCTRTQIALSTAGIAAALVGTTVGITYAVKSHNHTLNGCAFSDASGLKLRNSDATVYTLKGATAAIKDGDRVRLHGSKEKKAKGDSTGDRIFVVQKLNKDYGPCSANLAPSRTPAQ